MRWFRVSTNFSTRWAHAEVHLGLIQHNVAIVAQAVAPAQVWAVVKANAYGHGAIPVAQAALSAGATGLCVAVVDEGVALRRAGITVPILLLSEQPGDLADLIVGYQLTPTITTTLGAATIGAAALSAQRCVDVHLKIDTGMHRVGVSPKEALTLARYIVSQESLKLEGVYTHFAAADDPAHEANGRQLAEFKKVLDLLESKGISIPLVHAANSAAALSFPDAHFSMVRLGIAMYGLRPGSGVEEFCRGLIPAMSIKARIAAVRWVDAGQAVSYGLLKPLTKGSLIATVPIGYADGVPRRLVGTDIHVLIKGQPHPFAGAITMDQIMIDCASDSSIAVGDEVVLIGRQGDLSVTADDWADALGTIGYEIVCGISNRMYRAYK